MERRRLFTNKKIYHVYNKSIESKEVFKSHRNCSHFLQLLEYYRSSKAKISYSKLKEIRDDLKKRILKDILYKKHFKIEILAYCLMPNHFHLLLRQKKIHGITQFMSQLSNAFTKYVNLKYDRAGPLFIAPFKSVLITTEEQLKHVSRYIHLNPFSSGLIKTINQLENYRLSSYKEHINNVSSVLSNPEYVLSFFDHSKDKYKEFVLDNADYQKSLEQLKHTEKWT